MGYFFEGAFPEPKSIFRKNPDATLMDFLDDEKLFVVHRREWLTYDLLVQPDIREIICLIGLGRSVRPFVNLSRSEAHFRLLEIRRNFEAAKPVIAQNLDRPEIQDICRRIFWGKPTLLRLNPRRNLRYKEPFYLPTRTSLMAPSHRTFEKMRY